MLSLVAACRYGSRHDRISPWLSYLAKNLAAIGFSLSLLNGALCNAQPLPLLENTETTITPNPSMDPAVPTTTATATATSNITLSLPQLKQKLHQTLLTALLPEKQHQREALFSLEKQLASSGDFKGAIRARDQRLIIEEEIASTQQQLLNPHVTNPVAVLKTPITLPLAQATLSQLSLDPTSQALTDWSPNASVASFQLPNLPPGGYEIIVTYTLSASTNATLQFKESRFGLNASLAPTTSTSKPTEMNCGILRITNGSGSLSLQALQLPLDHSLQIHSLTLIPGGH